MCHRSWRPYKQMRARSRYRQMRKTKQDRLRQCSRQETSEPVTIC